MSMQHDWPMPKRRPDGVAELRSLVETHLTKQLAAASTGALGANSPSPSFRFSIDGTGTKYGTDAPAVVFHAQGRHAVPIYEFPISRTVRKVITSLGEGDGNELLMCGVPPVEAVGAYVEEFAGSVVGQDDAGFVPFFNHWLGYWHLAEAGIVAAGYDSETEGFWGREGWRFWKRRVAPDELVERVTLDAYLSSERSADRGRDEGSRIAIRKQPLEALAEPDDEWWQWVSGKEPLMQHGGLALVRGGRVVWARRDWIS